MTCRLYAITPPRFELSPFLAQVEEALDSGEIACLQLRLKEASDAEIITAGKALAAICRRHETAFILNDRVDLVHACHAEGVHVGQEDLETTSLAAIRKTLGEDAVIGVTCHASRHLAMEAGESIADYVAFGAFYPTTSKPLEKLEKWGTPTRELVEWWSMFSTLPQVAIGGITPQNLAPLVQAGADFIAAITGIWNHPEGAKAGVIAYHQAIAIAEQAMQKEDIEDAAIEDKDEK
jgi:thiamine-phosphate pyrophosphorylase